MRIVFLFCFLFIQYAKANMWEISDAAVSAGAVMEEAIELADHISENSSDQENSIRKAQEKLRQAQAVVNDVSEGIDTTKDLFSDDMMSGNDLLTSMRKVNYRLRKIKNLKNLITRLASTKTDALVATQVMDSNTMLASILDEQVKFRAERFAERSERKRRELEALIAEREQQKFFAKQFSLMRPARKYLMASYRLSDSGGSASTSSIQPKKTLWGQN